jgi:hypothetical protein
MYVTETLSLKPLIVLIMFRMSFTNFSKLVADVDANFGSTRYDLVPGLYWTFFVLDEESSSVGIYLCNDKFKKTNSNAESACFKFDERKVAKFLLYLGSFRTTHSFVCSMAFTGTISSMPATCEIQK